MKAANSEPEIVTRNGKPVSVILPIKKYQEMIERLEDVEDVVWLKKARKRPLHYRPLKEYLADRKARV
jgi:prevent-host-death family protein